MSNQPLTYAPAPRPSRMHRWWKWALLILLASALYAGWRWSEPWRPQLAYLYWQRQCLIHERAPVALAYDEVPDSATALRKFDSQYFAPHRQYFDFPGGRPPSNWSPPALFVPTPWTKLGTPHAGPDVAAVAFLHERSVGQQQRLVVVTVGSTAIGPKGHAVVFAGRPYLPASFTPGSRVSGSQRSWPLIVTLMPNQRLRVFAGQSDPEHSDHFAIGFEIDGKPGTIDAWLRDRAWANRQDHRWPKDTECVELRVRAGPGLWSENGVIRKAH
jgi:hypothetical protein